MISATWGDAQLAEVVEGAGGERDDGGSFLVRQRLGVSEAGVVVHDRVRKSPSRSSGGGFAPAVDLPSPAGGYGSKLLNIHMQQLTRPFTFIPYHRPGRGLQRLAGQRVAFPQTQHPVAAEDAADRPLRHPRKRRQPARPRPQHPPRPQHQLFHRRAGTHGGTFRPRRPILQTGLAFLPVAAHPLGHALPGHPHTAEPPAPPAPLLLSPATPSPNAPKATTSRYHASLKTSSRAIAIGFISLPITPGGLHLCNNQTVTNVLAKYS